MSELPSLKYLVYRDFKGDYIPQIIDELYLKKIYDPYLLGKKDLVIADFGANQGITATYFYPFAKKLFAVEPAKQHLEVLSHLKELNNLKNMEIMPYAISNVSGKTFLNHTPNPTSFMIVPDVLPKEFGNEEVEMITIGDFFKKADIDHLDILKLDIEGMEGKLIASQEFAKYAPKIKIILGEWHDWSGMSKNMFVNTLRDLGYEFKWRHDTQAACFEAFRL